MADWHLLQLEDRLRMVGWTVTDVLPGDGYRTSAVWVVRRGREERRIAFEGQTEQGSALPLERAYGCNVEEADADLYFGKKSSSRWRDELAHFVATLNRER